MTMNMSMYIYVCGDGGGGGGGSMCAVWTGELLSLGLYSMLIDLKGYPFLDAEPPAWANMTLKATDLMTPEIVVLKPIDTVKKIRAVVEKTSHNCYPLIYPPDTRRPGALFGTIMRDRLVILLKCKCFSSRLATTTSLDWDPDTPDAMSPVMDFQTLIVQGAGLRRKDIDHPTLNIR